MRERDRTRERQMKREEVRERGEKGRNRVRKTEEDRGGERNYY